MGLSLTERKQIANGVYENKEELPHYDDGKPAEEPSWLKRNLYLPKTGEQWGSAATGAVGFTTSLMDAFGPVKSASNLMSEAGTSVGQGAGFTYQKQNAVDASAQMDALSKENTANTLKTAATGAQLGSTFGPIGAAAGGIIGGIAGLFGGASRKRRMIENMKTASINTKNLNNYNLASAQSDYMQSQFNMEYGNTQDDQIYAAADGMMPRVMPNLFNGKPNAMVSNGEIVGHMAPDGTVLDAVRVGHGKDNKDTIPVKLKDGMEPSDSSFVITNKHGISDYVAATGDVAGGLKMQKDMKEFQRYKQLWNGKIPFANGKLPGFVFGKDSPIMKAMQQQQNGIQTAIDTAMDTVKGNSSDSATTPQFKLNVATPYFQTDDEKYKKPASAGNNTQYDTTGSKRLSLWTPALLGGLGMAMAYGMRGGEPSANHIYTPNKYEGQIKNLLANRRANLLDQKEEARSAERRGLNVLRNSGLTSGRYIPAFIANAAATQRLHGNIAALANRENNGYRLDAANMFNNMGQSDQNALMRDALEYNNAYDRAHAMSVGRTDNAWAQMLGQAQQAYKNLVTANTRNNMFALYDSDYALRRNGGLFT